jgi:DNA mismatch repair protein MutS2
MTRLNETAVSLSGLDWLGVLERLRGLATSELVRVRLDNLQPMGSAKEAESSFRQVKEGLQILLQGQRPFMESLDHQAAWFQRLKREAVLTTLELRDVRRFCTEVIALSEAIRPLSGLWLDRVKARLMDATHALSAIDDLMTPGGEIRPDASETLSRLHRDKTNQTNALQGVLDRLVKQHDMEPVLQERYVTTREGRWVIPVRSGMQGFFPGLIHGASQSKQTVFMEPDEVVPLNNRLRQIEASIEEEIERLLNEISIYLRSILGEFQDSAQCLEEVDAILAKAQLASLLGAEAIQFSATDFDLRDLRHPLLVLRGVEVVPNTVRLEHGRRILLLSGPNAGGKTVLLKSVALAAQMARCGLLVCADSTSRIPFFSKVVASVGDAQSVDQDLSTFAAHLRVLDQATRVSGSDVLILVDEICGSTDPEEGSALARSFIEAFAANQVFAVVTSHLGLLKTGWGESSGVINGSLEYHAESGQPTYQFFLGVPGNSLALQTARRVGVSEAILRRAVGHLTPEARQRQESLAEVERMKEEIQELRIQLVNETRETRETKKKFSELVALFKRDRESWLERVAKRAERKVDDLIEKAGAESVFKKFDRLQQLRNEIPQIVKAQTSSANRRMTIESLEDFERVYPAGSLVHIGNLGQDGVIQGKANQKGEVPVVSNSMRLMVHWQSLKPPLTQTNPTQTLLRRASGVSVTMVDNERSIDVRGKSVEDAVALLETQLDAAALNQETRVKIIHGHGTDTLKKAVRAHLSRSLYIKKWRAGGAETGGDGVTWADLS